MSAPESMKQSEIDDRAEHLALDVLEGGERQEHEDRDDDAEDGGRATVRHRVHDRDVASASIRRRSRRGSSACSTMTTAPSTTMPKSIAPRLMTLPRVADGVEADEPDEHRERDRARDQEAGAQGCPA